MTFPVDQVIRSKRKTLALIVKPDGSVLVRAPLRTPRTVIHAFVVRNKRWIETKQAEVLATLPPPTREYVSGQTFPYLGTSYPLDIVEGQRKPLLLDTGKFRLAVLHQKDAASVFERWYREQARQALSARVELFARANDFHYKGIRITSARTRWGSCSATGSLSFSWRLIQAPPVVVDYVVVHELVHTAVHNHSKKFWQRVGMIMPDFQEHRKWLREHGRELLR
jgi:predicted metal-dependent hydrolase